MLIIALMSSTVPITIRVPPELRDKLQAFADADRRTLSAFVNLRLEEVVKQLEREQEGRPANG